MSAPTCLDAVEGDSVLGDKFIADVVIIQYVESNHSQVGKMKVKCETLIIEWILTWRKVI